MVSAGEETGALDQVMARLADHLDEIAELRGRVRSALLYPALMAIVAGIGVTVILLFVVPRFAAMLSEVGGELPLSTRALMAMSGVVVKWWIVWIPLLALVILGVRRWMTSPDHRRTWHIARLSLPVTGQLERDYTTARFTRTLGLLLRSGVGLIPSLRIARSSVSNLAIGEAIERATAAVTQGKRLSAELHGALPPLAEQLIAVGEESGQLDELCLRASESYDRETSRRLRTLIGLIEPALILVFGLLVGFVALAMLQAVYSVNAQVL
jgi:type II secretory pathway component PulF